MSFSFRRDFITRPIYAWAHKALPPMSDTEREALEAGDVWWDADLFTGRPDWAKLLATPQAKAGSLQRSLRLLRRSPASSPLSISALRRMQTAPRFLLVAEKRRAKADREGTSFPSACSQML